ncbi:cobyrinate a,c-diamide synthase [Leptolyngbya iicbica]|uniref:Cobyrinate a,c-diamide synthase n=2 Tax=Cyanophyceae TaxID=3028117 RepID=A0A4Q7EG71_9CYAN|nr:cobyrinate a,c-diamide synthase [Leptolyngbya sp. LK]RZM82273.1 cobyrinate a,c-diamide synthase [Leptolyngbya sp. LK]
MGGLIIAGDRSSAGKTTVTMALLSALRQRSVTVQAFKVGPDYIDPMFHRAITGRPAYNLDPVMTSESYVQQCFQRHAGTATYAIVEGVMGLFDGAGGTDWASTAHIARLLGCPVLLVVDCARLSRSLAAIVHGYQTLDPEVQLVGVVLNRVGSDRHLAMLQAAIAPLQIPVLGVLRRDDAVALPDRHLGLVPTDELSDLPQRFQHLAALGQRCFDWPALERVLQASGNNVPVSAKATDAFPSAEVSRAAIPPLAHSARTIRPLKIGIARDLAFNFYYEDNLAYLNRLGAELVPFSPQVDAALPTDLSGLLLGGGFPEMFAEALAQNTAMRRAIAQALAAGLPTYAECGGLMYLCKSLVDLDGRSWPMVGTIPATTTMTGQLTLGYRQVTALQNSAVATVGQRYWGHEFHRSAIAPTPTAPLSALSSYPLLHEPASSTGTDGWGRATLHAAYVHVHWGGQPALAEKFVATCDRYRNQPSSPSPPR